MEVWRKSCLTLDTMEDPSTAMVLLHMQTAPEAEVVISSPRLLSGLLKFRKKLSRQVHC